MNYVKAKNAIYTFKAFLLEIKSIDELKTWYKSANFEQSILDELIDPEEIGEEDDLVNHRLELLDDLIVSLEKFEDEFRNLQVNKFKQLELIRIAEAYVSKARGTMVGRSDYDTEIITETKECGHPPCGKIFIADPPSKMYCSERCREKAKKWRRRHGEE